MKLSTKEKALWALTALNLGGAAGFPLLLAGNGRAAAAGWFSLAAGLLFYALPAGSARFWDSARARLAGAASLLWGLYLLLYARGLSGWLLDVLFAVLALLLWLGRGRPELLVTALGVFAVMGAGRLPAWPLAAAAVLALAWFASSHGLRLAGALAARKGAPARTTPLKAGLALLALLLLGWFIGRPLYLMVHPASRHRYLEARQPAFPVTAPEKLTPQARALRAHVTALAETIGERSAFQPDEQDKARDYIAAQLRGMGYEVELQEYSAMRPSASGRVRPYYNVEARLVPPVPKEGGAWILGAHYDTAPGTPGAEDNASAVAALLEAARALKKAPPEREVRFIAYSTEEPPAFTTRDMGSYRYLRLLRERGVRVYGLLNLDMVGYFNDRPGSQLFPPLLSALHPDRGDFVSLASNLGSLGLLRSVSGHWREASALQVEPVFLPAMLSALFLGDHLNFWHAGERAVFVTDTAYFRFPWYHQAEDTPEKLDYERLAELTRAVTAVLSAE